MLRPPSEGARAISEEGEEMKMRLVTHTRLLAVLGLLIGSSLLIAANPIRGFFNDTQCLSDQQCDAATNDLKCPTTNCSGGTGAPTCKKQDTSGGGFDFQWCKCGPLGGPPQSSDECHAMLKKPNNQPPAAFDCACTPSDCGTGTGTKLCDWESGTQAYKKCVCPPGDQ